MKKLLSTHDYKMLALLEELYEQKNETLISTLSDQLEIRYPLIFKSLINYLLLSQSHQIIEVLNYRYLIAFLFVTCIILFMQIV